MKENEIYINYIDDQTTNDHPHKEKKKKKRSKLTTTLLVFDILAVIELFLTYGPISYFRNLLVTTAMTTMTHKYLAYIFYDKNMVTDILSSNYVEEFNGNSDSSNIVFKDPSETTSYESIYEEQILKKEHPGDLYKLINIEENGTKGYLVVIYDPSRISLETSPKLATGGQKLLDFATDKEAIVAINASGFTKSRTKAIKPTGTVIKDGKILSVGSSTGFPGGGLIGFNKDNVLVLTTEDANTAIKKGIRDGMEFGPFLIMNGKPASIKGNGGFGYAPRTAIAQRQDGIVLFLVFDGRDFGRNLGASMNDVTNLFLRYKAYNATNLDGGGSCTLVIEDELINKPSGGSYTGARYIPNSWMVK
jgi:exopolysaccharide biosynthesis protein